MKCLFLFGEAPLSQDFSGAASRHLQSFRALKSLGVELHVWRFLAEGVREKVVAHERREASRAADPRAQASSWTDVVHPGAAACRTRLELLSRAAFDPAGLAFPEARALRGDLMNAVRELQPHFLWAESGAAGALAASLAAELPFVYAQTDLHHRLLRLRRRAAPRRPYPSERIHLWAVRRGEMQVIRRAAAVLTGSQTEAEELHRLGGRNISVIPTTYEAVELDLSKPRPADGTPARVLHLGSLRTTSNYLGLMAYLQKVQPRFEGLPGGMPLHIVGDADGAKPELLERLEACGAVLHGHVDDLGSVLRPFDIAVIPYEHDTGTRTKLSLLFNHAQAVVATRASVAGSGEVRPGVNCLVLPDLDAFAEALPALARDRARRERLGGNARRTFESGFTLEAQLPRFAQVLEGLRLPASGGGRVRTAP